MYSFLYKITAWLAQKLVVAGLIVVLGLAAYGLWLFIQEQGTFDARRTENLRVLTGERDHLLAVRAEIEQRLISMRAEVEKQQDRAKQAEKIITTLRSLESWWDRLWANPEQQKVNAERIKQMEELKTGASASVVELQRAITQVLWEKDGLEIQLSRLNREIRLLEESRSEVVHYFHRAWNAAKWYVLVALATYFFGPTLWALAMFYGFAPLIARGRPIRLSDELGLRPQVGESRVSIEAPLWPGDVLRIKEKFLQASDEGISKKTRFVLDWKIPFTSLACGLIELVELRNAQAGSEYRATLSNADDPHTELAIVDVPEGGSLVLRPSFLAGVIQPGERPLRIKRRWQVFRWQSWATGQFRFFEFVGPCRLVVAGSRGVRAENLAIREGQREPARRTNQDATIGFTPNLKYRPVRAETFWSYYRGMNPLFDDLFAGEGVFLLQETATAGGAARAGKFWSTVWNGVLKVFGL